MNVITKNYMKIHYRMSSIFTNLQVNSKDFNHNLKYVDRIEITINNPNNVKPDSLFKSTVYEATVTFNKNNMTLYKRFNNNNYDEIINNIKTFMNDEIKI